MGTDRDQDIGLAFGWNGHHDGLGVANGVFIQATLDLSGMRGFADPRGRGVCARQVARPDAHAGARARKAQR